MKLPGWFSRSSSRCVRARQPGGVLRFVSIRSLAKFENDRADRSVIRLVFVLAFASRPASAGAAANLVERRVGHGIPLGPLLAGGSYPIQRRAVFKILRRIVIKGHGEAMGGVALHEDRDVTPAIRLLDYFVKALQWFSEGGFQQIVDQHGPVIARAAREVLPILARRRECKIPAFLS